MSKKPPTKRGQKKAALSLSKPRPRQDAAAVIAEFVSRLEQVLSHKKQPQSQGDHHE
jgi:hypothetical protein